MNETHQFVGRNSLDLFRCGRREGDRGRGSAAGTRRRPVPRQHPLDHRGGQEPSGGRLAGAHPLRRPARPRRPGPRLQSRHSR